MFKQLSKGGLSDDAIKKMVENAGEEGLEWLSKQVKNGVSGEILEKIAKNAVDYTKYSDDLIRKIASSNGYADDIIKYVNKYGDDAVKAITKYGDDAAKVISDYADDGLKALADGIEPKFINHLYNSGINPSEYSHYGILSNDAAKSVDDAINVKYPDDGNYGSAKTWKEYYEANGYTSAEGASKDYNDLVKNTSPWPKGYTPKDVTLKKGDTVYIAVIEGVGKQYDNQTGKIFALGGFASKEPIPNMTYLRDSLAVKEGWKSSSESIYTLELKLTNNVNVKSGPIGPQIDVLPDKGIDRYLPGSSTGTQYQFGYGELIKNSELVNAVKIN